MPSTDLIAGAQGGDLAAIASLLAAAQPDIRRYARATCAASDVDDAVQDTLWLVHRKIGGLRGIAAFSGWLFAIVKRECVRLARRALAGGRPIEDFANDLQLSERPDTELRIDLAEAIASLPDHYRVVVILRDIEELTIAEIGGRLGTTKAATKARLHRGRALIREYLAR
jgi:RNA polymerase sigma factor (sigma-70 family)